MIKYPQTLPAIKQHFSLILYFPHRFWKVIIASPSQGHLAFSRTEEMVFELSPPKHTVLIDQIFSITPTEILHLNATNKHLNIGGYQYEFGLIWNLLLPNKMFPNSTSLMLFSISLKSCFHLFLSHLYSYYRRIQIGLGI